MLVWPNAQGALLDAFETFHSFVLLCQCMIFACRLGKILFECTQSNDDKLAAVLTCFSVDTTSGRFTTNLYSTPCHYFIIGSAVHSTWASGREREGGEGAAAVQTTYFPFRGELAGLLPPTNSSLVIL